MKTLSDVLKPELSTLNDVLNFLKPEFSTYNTVFSEIPIFGNFDYRNTSGVYSWDKNKKLIWNGEKFEIVDISEKEHKTKLLTVHFHPYL